MKKFIVFAILMCAAVCFGADVAPVAAPVSASYFGWFTTNWGLIAGVLLAVEQVLAATSLKSNSTFQLICNLIDGLVKKPVA